ncbi:CU044_5270 family protein [Actinomadura rugatobispora]|uniref:CU044_5270 family protein n=1 Tax=Actinomadura rugatobispora TaxID=1994 RepID=A0ABW1A153_9ACTN|nr:hypothetical protein GCM10010200_065150 [Actinomadura rugatobispora]
MNDLDDLETLRAAWAGTEPPSDEARATARAALLERAAADAPSAPRTRRGFRLPRLGVRLVAVAALAAAIATGVTVLQSWGGDRAVVPGVPPAPAASAAEALDRAATAAERRPFTTPRPDQWVYTRYKNVKVKERWPLTDSAGNDFSSRIVEEQWARADGRRSAYRDGGKLHFVNEERRPQDVWPPSDYAVLAALPTDPDELLALVYRHVPPVEEPHSRPGVRLLGCPPDPRSLRDDYAFNDLLRMLGNGMPPPKVEAAIYRAMKKTPGVLVTKHLGPGDDQAEVGLGRHVSGWQFNEVLFDARTYRYVGQRSTAVKDRREVMKACGALSGGGLNMRVVGSGVVDKAGQRP